jgi:hypothetical protein
VEQVGDRMALALRWAYALAETGRYSDYRKVIKAVIAEGFAEAADWLNRPSIRESLATICVTSQQRQRRP